MNVGVRRLAEDSGKLLAAAGSAAAACGRFEGLWLEFEAGVLALTCDVDTDEVVVAAADRGRDCPDGMLPALADLVGLSIEYAWELRNHRGYVDGFQLRLRDGSGREETLQLEVMASSFYVRRVV